MKNKLPTSLNDLDTQTVKAALHVLDGIKDPQNLPYDTKKDVVAAVQSIHDTLRLAGCRDYKIVLHDGKPLVTYMMMAKSAPIGVITIHDALELLGR